jgi:hypothetical protein
VKLHYLPVSAPVEHHFPDAPYVWHGWLAEWRVGFYDTPWTAYSSRLYQDYFRNHWRSAAETVFSPDNDDIYVFYSLVVVDREPKLEWDADWSIRRRGTESGLGKKCPPERYIESLGIFETTLISFGNTPFNTGDYSYTGPFYGLVGDWWTPQIGRQCPGEVTHDKKETFIHAGVQGRGGWPDS